MDPRPEDPERPRDTRALLARYTSAPLPAYRYVPGKTPHPRSDPRGHSYGHTEARSATILPAAWASSEPWKRGVDLFNGGYYWEAHEAWEMLWRGSGGGGTRSGLLADFLQGLIQIAAAHLKRSMGALAAADALRDRGLRRVAGAPSPWLGMDVRRFESETLAYFRGDRDEPTRIVLEIA